MKLLRVLMFLCLALAAIPAGAENYIPRRDRVEGPVRAAVTQVIDGDTIEARVHVWIGEDIVTRIRVDGIDAPELHGKCGNERARAQAAKREMERLLADGTVVLTGIRLEKYAGRVLARVATGDGADVARHMMDKNLVRAYHGKKRGSWCDA
jgi:micrococcal nuclease